jgi:hypothetical protein
VLFRSDDLNHELWQFDVLKKIGVELKEEDFGSIKEIISGISDNEDLKSARQKAKEEAWFYQGEAGKRTADFMIETRENLNRTVDKT